MLARAAMLVVFVLVLLQVPVDDTALAVPAGATTGLSADTTTSDDGDAPKKRMKPRDYARRLQSKVKEPGPPPEQPRYKPWNKVVTKDHKKHEGLVPIYTKQEEVLFELSKDMLDKPMLAVMSLSQGIGSHFVFGGLPVDDVMFDFHRQEDHVQVRRLSTRFRAPDDPGLQNTLDLTFTESILVALPIMTEKDDKIVVDVSKFYLSDVAGMSQWLGGVFNQPVRLNADKGYFASIKNYPENTEIDTRLTFSPSRANALNLPNVPDPRYVQVGVQYSIRKLPEDPMMPRIADDRIGYFTEVHKDFTREGEESFFVHYATRWRLEKKDPSVTLSEPVKPIVFYVDRTIPDRYADYVIEGIEMWQRAFEKAGFKNAIIGKRAPTPEEDPEYDPEDSRYNTIRWNTSDSPLYGAIGPSRVDPRTGEIIDADILFEHNLVAGFGRSWKRMAEPRAMLMDVDPGLKEFWLTDDEKAEEAALRSIPFLRDEPDAACRMNDCMAFNGRMQWLAMVSSGMLSRGAAMPEEFIGEALRFVTAHEVGHTLGLRHNFKSSGSTPYDRLHDRDTVEKIGMAGSVMDYPAANIARDADRQGYYYAPGLGTYDDWAIEWGYKPVRGDDPWAQSEKLTRITAESTEKEHLYGTDWDAYPQHALDPRVNIWDLSDNPLAWSEERADLCSDLLANGKLEDVVVAEGDSYNPLRNAVVTLFLQQYLVCSNSIKYIGGQYEQMAHRGDGAVPLTPVPAAQQKQAFDFVLGHMLDCNRFVLSPQMLNKLADNKMSNWQNNLYQPRRYDFPLSAWVSGMQNAILTNMLSPARQTRVVETRFKVDDPFMLSDLYNGLTDGIWKQSITPGSKQADMHRNLQRVYTDKLIQQVTTPIPGTPQDAVALSRLHLRRIRDTASGAMQGQRLDDVTTAHMMETVARIDRALDAQRLTGF